MKKNIVISTIGLLILSSSVFAEWKAGDNIWLATYPASDSNCQGEIEVWKIKGINNGVVKVLFNNSGISGFRKIETIRNAHSTIESANKSKLLVEKSCRKQAELKKQYEKK